MAGKNPSSEWVFSSPGWPGHCPSGRGSPPSRTAWSQSPLGSGAFFALAEKAPSARSLAPTYPRKGPLGSPARLQAPSQRLAVATTFSRAGARRRCALSRQGGLEGNGRPRIGVPQKAPAAQAGYPLPLLRYGWQRPCPRFSGNRGAGTFFCKRKSRFLFGKKTTGMEMSLAYSDACRYN